MSLDLAPRNALAAAVLGRVSYQGPATLHAALIVGASTALTGGTEATGGSYARVAITNNQTNFPAPTTGVVTNASPITFPTSSAAWGAVNAVRLFDAASGGNLLGGALISPGATVDATGITVSFPASNLSFTVV
jgi:hypothetical protein